MVDASLTPSADLPGACLVMTTVESPALAGEIARRLVKDRLAACVQILPAMTSVYSWEGRIEEAQESLLLIKTVRSAYPALEATLRQIHPYQTPEIIMLPIDAGLPDYLAWMAGVTTRSPED
jgi:periplasmic divalent cation tolerance protein